MNKLIALLIVAVMLISCFPSFAEEGNNLDEFKGVHPRLFLSEDGFTELRRSIEGDEKMSALREIFLKKMDGIITEDPPDYYEGDIEDLWIRAIGDNIGNMVMAFKLTLDRKYLEAATRWIKKTAEYPQWGRGAYTDNDLACAHMLTAISLYYDWAYHDLSESERAFTVELLAKKGTKMRPGTWYNSAYLQNHLWISISSCLLTATAIYDVYPQSEEWFSYVFSKYEKVFYYLSDDGATHEGLGYWNYGMTAIIQLMEVGGKFFNKDYSEYPYIKYACDYANYMNLPINNGKNSTTMGLFNFGDAAGGNAESAFGAVAYMARVNQSKTGQWLANRYLDLFVRTNTSPNGMPFIFYDYNLEEEPPEKSMPTAKLFDDLNYVVLRSDWSGDESAIAFRSGPVMGKKAVNADERYDLGTGHTHSDVNAPIVYANNEWILPDDGYVTNSTAQHNTLLVNGGGQYGAGGSWPVEAVNASPVVEKFVPGELVDYVVTDGAAAYPPVAELNRFRRHFIYAKPDVLIIVDDIEANKASDLELRFHPAVQSTFPLPDGSFLFLGNNSKYMIKPFLEDGVKSDSAMLAQHSNKTGGKADRLTIQLTNRASNWVQATAVSWADKENEAKQVGCVREGNLFKFTVDNTTIILNIEDMSISTQTMKFDINVKFNGIFMNFDITPIMERNRILIPVTQFCDFMNLSSSYNRERREISFKNSDTAVNMRILSGEYSVNGELRKTDSPPLIRNGTVYIPLRAACEAFGLGVSYDEAGGVASITGDSIGEIGIAGLFVNSVLASAVSENRFECATLAGDRDKPDIYIIQNVYGTTVDIEYADEIFGEHNITLSSPDGRQEKKYVLETKPYVGSGEIGVYNISYSGSDGNIGENTIDGNLDTRWSADGMGEWLLCDFGKPVTVSGVGLAYYAGDTRTSSFEIQVSDDGENFRTVLDTKSSGNTLNIERFNFSAPVTTRYIRYYGKGNSNNLWNSVTELGFFK